MILYNIFVATRVLQHFISNKIRARFAVKNLLDN